jgi:phosphate transport system substrate-binding protein
MEGFKDPGQILRTQTPTPAGPPRCGRHHAFLPALGALALVAAACGGGTPSSGLTGSIDISGSSTVEQISARVAETFAGLHPEVAIKVEGPGTGDGALLFCRGEIDIADASRPLKDGEKQLCAENGVDYIELMVATDGISVLTSKNDTRYQCLDPKDLYALLGPESVGFAKWSDANTLAAEIGAPNSPYPDTPLSVTAPGEESGTYDTFVSFIIKGKAGGLDFTKPEPDGRGAVAALRPDYVASPNDNVIVEGVAGSPGSIGFVGYAFYRESQDRVRAYAINGAHGCVDPTPATIADGSYPLSRPLFIYVNAKSAAPETAVAAFVDLYLSEQGLAAIDRAGYVRLKDYGPTLSRWQERKTG